MTTACHHCQAEIEIDPATLAALLSQTHFECPACNGQVSAPQAPLTPVKVTTAAALQPARVQPSAPKAPQAIRGLNRNFLILGAMALLVLGGLGFFLASQKSGNTNITNQNIRNEILNNAYFTQLIASGVTTKEDLEKIGDIRPYGDGLIGISTAKLGWKEANAMALRTGASVLEVGSDESLSTWLINTFSGDPTAWVLSQGDVSLLKNSGVNALKQTEGNHKVLLQWLPERHNHPIGLVAYYQFNGNAEDSSGNGNHARVHGAKLTFDKAGNPESAYQFDSISSFILAPVDINPDVMPSMTIAAWARANTDQPKQPIISHDTGGFARTISIDNRGGGIGWSAFSGTGSVLGFEPVSVGEWDFVAVVYDQSQEITTLFVNGRKLMKHGCLPQGMKNLTIGKNPSYQAAFNGVIDEVRIYNRAPSENEIQNLFQAFTEQVSSSQEEKQLDHRLVALAKRDPERATKISGILNLIVELERGLAALNGKFDWRIHNELRHHCHATKTLFHEASRDYERMEMLHCNKIFNHQIGDEYILNCISAWSAKTDPVRAAESLLLWTEKYPLYPYLTAACLLRSAELLGPEKKWSTRVWMDIEQRLKV